MTRTSTHVLVPCPVTVPDLNVTLHAVRVANLVSLYLPLLLKVKLSSADS